MHIKAALTINAHDHGMRLFLAVVIIILLCAGDQAYMRGRNTELAMSALRSVAASINRQTDNLLRHLRG
jgi:hypothetical protein